MFLSHNNIEFTNRSFVKYVRVIIFCLSVVYINSCTPDNTINPAQYEIYISISSDQTPAVSPDGEWIAYYHKNLESPENPDYPTGLYIMSINGNNRRLLIKGSHFQPAWSPDGKWIVFSSDGVIQIINFSGDSIRTYQGLNDLPFYSPDWSSDGKSIIISAPITEAGGVYTITPDFSETTHLLKPLENNGMYASYSRDDKKIVYEKGGQSLSSVEIFILELSSMAETRLTYNKYDDRHSRWSPANDLIAWSRHVQIFKMNIDGSNQQRLDYGQYPSWTPDGEKIVYSNANSNFTKEVLWIIDINGTDKLQLTF